MRSRSFLTGCGCLMFVLLTSHGTAPAQGGARRNGRSVGAAAAPSHPEWHVGTTRFDWPTRCTVPIRFTSARDGHSADGSFRISVSAGTDGERLVSLHDYTIARYDGHGPEEAAYRAAFEQLRASLSVALPTLVIGADGRFVGSEGIEALVDAIVRMRGGSAEEQARVRTAMLAAPMRSLLSATGAKYWHGWVQNWLDCDLTIEEGEVLEGFVPLQVPGTTDTFEAPVRFERGRDTARGIQVDQTVVFDGDAARAIVGRTLVQVVPELASPDGGLPVAEVRLSRRHWAEIEPTTLRPFRTRSDETIAITMADGTTRTRSGVWELTWDWDRATDCTEP